MQELELTWRHAISVWWLIVWRGAIGAAVMGGAVGFLVAFLALLAGAPSLYVAYFNMAIGALIGVFWMIVWPRTISTATATATSSGATRRATWRSGR
jgi:hypothetical protein